MKKKLQKLFALTLCAAMTLSYGIPAVSAEDTPVSPQITTTDHSWLQTFTGYEGGWNDKNQVISPDGMGLSFSQKINTPSGAKGKFGKSDQDTAFVQTIDPETGADAGSDWSYMQYENKTEAYFPNIGTALEEDDILHISFEFATDSLTGNRACQFNMLNAGGAWKAKDILSIANNSGRVNFANQMVLSKLPVNQWVRFDMVFYPVDNTADVYVDGSKKLNRVSFADSNFTAPSKGFNRIRFWLRPAKSGDTYPTVHNYIDNFYSAVSKTAPVIAPITVTANNPEISVNEETKTITAPNTLSPAALKASLTGSGNARIEAVTQAGVSQSETLENGYINVLDENGQYAYYTLNVFEMKSYLNENFNKASFTDADTLKSQTGLSFVSEFADTLATNISAAGGLGGRPSQDKSAVFATEKYPGGLGSINLNYESDTNITEDTLSIEASLLIKGTDAPVSIQVPMNNDMAYMRTLVSFEKDGSIKADGNITGLKWKENNWYKIAATIDLANAKWDVYINGQQVINKGALGNLTTVDFIKRFKIYVNMPSEAGNYSNYFALDDCKVYNSPYNPLSDQMSVYAKDDTYIVSSADKKIYIPSNTTRSDFLSRLTLSNGELAGIYTNETLSAAVSGDTVSSGNTALFKTTQGNVYDTYEIMLMGDVLGIERASYIFDNSAHTIYAPVKTPAKEFCSQITLYGNHAGQLVIGDTPLSDTDLIERGKDIKYRISFNGKHIDYTLITEYKFDNFDAFTGQKLTNNTSFDGYTCYASTNQFYVEGTKEGNNSVLHAYVPKDTFADGQKTDALSLRRLNMAKQDIGSRFVVTWDLKADAIGGLDAMIFQYQDNSGNIWNYNNVLQITETGEIQFGMQSVGTFIPGKWHRFTMAFDIPQKLAILYINGEKARELPFSMLGNFDHIVNLILSSGSSKTQDRNILMDNFSVYQIYDIQALNASQMQSAATSVYDIIGADNIISGYGNTTAANLVHSLLTLPQGVSATVYNSNATAVDDNTPAAKDMTIMITAEDGRHTTSYTLGDPLRCQLGITIDGRNVSQLYAGDAGSSAKTYSVTPQSAVLVLEQYKDGHLVQSKASDIKTITGAADFSVSLDTSVTDEPGISLKASLYNNLTDKVLLAPVTEIQYSETLELGTEILKVKGGRDAIYTITMDDGYGDSTEKFFRPWFENYNLTGTGLNMCVWMDTVNPVHKRYVENALEMTQNGILDIISHSYTHPSTPEAMDANLEQEVAGSKAFLQNLFPGQDVLSFGPGDGILTEKEKVLLRQHYYGVRTGTRGYNNLDLTDDEFQNIKVQGVLGKSGDNWKNPKAANDGETTQSMNKWLDTAVDQNKWLVEMWHSICWDDGTGEAYTSDGGYRPIQNDIAEGHIAYASQLQSEGKLWVAKFDDVIRYIRERQASTLKDNAKRTSRTITLTHTLDQALFNHSLTLKSEVPASWKYAKVMQGFGVQTPEVTEENGKYYIMYEAYPNEGQIEITQTDAPLEPEIKNLTIYTPERTQDYLETMEPVTFHVGINKTNAGEDTPSSLPVDEMQIHWYVNGQLQSQTGSSFTFMPQKTGDYRVYAQAGMVKSQFRALKILSADDIPMQNYFVRDSFDEYGDIGAAVPIGTWDYVDNRPSSGIKIAADPENSKNKVAQYWDDNQSTYYPFVNAPIDAGKPFVISGKAYLTLNRDMSHCIVAQNRDGKGYVQSSMVPLLSFNPGGVISTGGTWIGPNDTLLDGTWDANSWIRYELYVTPNNADPANSSVKITVSGVKDKSGNPAVLTFENTALDLSKTTYASNQKIDIGFVSALVKGAPDSAYVDDLKIYVPEPLKLRIKNKTDVALNGSVTVDLSHDMNSAGGLRTEDVLVTSEGKEVTVSSVDFDSMNPDRFTIHFSDGALKPNTEYTVSLTDRICDIAGNKVSSGASFTTGNKSITLPDNIIDAQIVKTFPNGKMKAVTAGFDDGTANYGNEKWLVDLFNANGIKGTFHLPSGSLNDDMIEQYKSLYTGHEVSTHTKNHTYYYGASPQLFEEELQADLERLPLISQNEIKGIAYPNGGSANQELKDLLKRNGIEYGRTTWSSKTFNLPDDLYNWNPTVFQNNVDELVTCANKFAALTPNEMSLFYIWGHSYQLNDTNKSKTQAAYETIGNKNDTWYATNIETANYLSAINRLVIEKDSNKIATVYNPSDITVWISVNGEPVAVPAGTSKAITVTGSASASNIEFNDPCSADPNSDSIKFLLRENGIGQAKNVPDPVTGQNDDGYARYAPSFTEDTVKGQVHSLTYQVTDMAYDITAFHLITYRNESRAGNFRVYASSDNISYTEVTYTTVKSNDKNSWYLWRYDLTGKTLPKGSKYIKIAFPANFETANNDTPNHALLMDVNLTFSQACEVTVSVTDTSPSDTPELVATVPENGSVNVSYDAAMMLIFNKAMDPATITKDTVTVEGASIQAITPSADNKVFTVTFDSLLEAGRTYTISLRESIQDTNGTALKATVRSFATEALNERTINDPLSDTRYAFQTHGDLNVTSGVGPDQEHDVHLVRLSADQAGDPSYIVYRAPYGEFRSFEILTYRNEGAVKAPFTIYTSSDGKTYEKLMDDTTAQKGEPDPKWYIPSTSANSSLPSGTKYIKIEFPAVTEGETAHHMATISNVNLAYIQTEHDKVSIQNTDFKGLDENRKIISGAVSIETASTGKATAGIEVQNFEPSLSGQNANTIFAVYKNGQLEQCYTSNLTLPLYGDTVFVRHEISLKDTQNLADYTIRCFIWDSMNGLTPLGSTAVIE